MEFTFLILQLPMRQGLLELKYKAATEHISTDNGGHVYITWICTYLLVSLLA